MKLVSGGREFAEAFEGFCVPFKGGCGADRALFRLYKATENDHFYTTNPDDARRAREEWGYKDEGVECYVWSP